MNTYVSMEESVRVAELCNPSIYMRNLAANKVVQPESEDQVRRAMSKKL